MTDSVKIDKEAVNSTIQKIIEDNDLSELTDKKVRRMIEKELNYPELSLDETEIKSFIKKKTSIFAEKKINKEAETSEKLEAKKTANKDINEIEKEGKSSSKKNPKVTNKKKPIIDNNLSDVQKKVNNKTNSKSKGDDTDSNGSRNENEDKSILSEGIDGMELSEVEDDAPEEAKKRTKNPKTSTEKKKKAKIEKDNDPDATKIANLKSYVFKCGVRKPWKKILKDLTPKQQIREIEGILRKLGMEGRPSIEKAKQIAMKRELQSEREALNLDNIIDEDRSARRSRRTSTNFYQLEPSSESEEEEEEAKLVNKEPMTETEDDKDKKEENYDEHQNNNEHESLPPSKRSKMNPPNELLDQKAEDFNQHLESEAKVEVTKNEDPLAAIIFSSP